MHHQTFMAKLLLCVMYIMLVETINELQTNTNSVLFI